MWGKVCGLVSQHPEDDSYVKLLIFSASLVARLFLGGLEPGGGGGGGVMLPR